MVVQNLLTSFEHVPEFVRTVRAALVRSVGDLGPIHRPKRDRGKLEPFPAFRNSFFNFSLYNRRPLFQETNEGIMKQIRNKLAKLSKFLVELKTFFLLLVSIGSSTCEFGPEVANIC